MANPAPDRAEEQVERRRSGLRPPPAPAHAEPSPADHALAARPPADRQGPPLLRSRTRRPDRQSLTRIQVPQRLEVKPTSVGSKFVLPGGEGAWTAAFTDGLAAVGVEEGAVRQALARSASRGLLTSAKVGRRVRWHLTPAAEELLRTGTERTYGFGREHLEWDGRWLLLFCSLPDRRRDLRYRLRVQLAWAGLAPFSPGAWITPWVDREGAVVSAVRALGLGVRRSATGRSARAEPGSTDRSARHRRRRRSSAGCGGRRPPTSPGTITGP